MANDAGKKGGYDFSVSCARAILGGGAPEVE
jgi:hypothetical protein